MKLSLVRPSVRRGLPFLFAIAIMLMATSCSTVQVRTEKGALSRESLKSAKILKNLGRHENSSIAKGCERCIQLLRDAKRQEIFGVRENAAAGYLKAAVEAKHLMESGGAIPGSVEEEKLIDLHNHSLARFAEIWSNDPRRLKPGPYRFEYRGEVFEIRQSPNSDYDSHYFDRAVATASIKGKGVADKHRAGFGASLVGIREQKPERAAELSRFPERGLYVPVSLTIDRIETIEDRQIVSVSLFNPVQRESVRVGDKTYPLAADFSAPMEMTLKGRNEVIWGLEGFFDAKDRIEKSGIYLTEPYDPARIPVILTHGLISVPIIWRDIIPEFMSEPDIAKRYQFMVFTYPSSFPIPESAQLFRHELKALRETYDPEGNDPLSRNIVAMGHSMGGVLTHLLVADIGDRLWNEIADVPLEKLAVPEEARAEIRDQVYFEPDKAVRRAVFLSTPHGGAELATLSAADVVSRLARFPADVLVTTLSTTVDVLDPNSGQKASGLKVDISKRTTSVQSLRPDSPVSVALMSSPFQPGVKYHSIIGDRGKGDTPDSSDGVVDYWSSHVDGAESELVVPTGHTTYTHPNAVDDLKRILRLHAGL
ncbi:MAG: alpha/beta hydrolase [Verrucomicrobiales bacterium]|nr:alpha/beta hydrolase [Verrucomicrobiales bacterium]